MSDLRDQLKGVLVDLGYIKFYTKDDGRVFIHPSSILFTEQKYDEPIVIYGSKVSTSKIFLRDCSACSSLPLLLLGGDLSLEHQGNSLNVDGIRFRAFPRITVLINGMRKLLDKLLDTKINHPSLDIIDTEIGRILVRLLSQ